MCITPVHPLEKRSLFYKSIFFLVSTGGENESQSEKSVTVSTEIPNDKKLTIAIYITVKHKIISPRLQTPTHGLPPVSCKLHFLCISYWEDNKGRNTT